MLVTLTFDLSLTVTLDLILINPFVAVVVEVWLVLTIPLFTSLSSDVSGRWAKSSNDDWCVVSDRFQDVMTVSSHWLTPCCDDHCLEMFVWCYIDWLYACNIVKACHCLRYCSALCSISYSQSHSHHAVSHTTPYNLSYHTMQSVILHRTVSHTTPYSQSYHNTVSHTTPYSQSYLRRTVSHTSIIQSVTPRHSQSYHTISQSYHTI